MRPHFMYGSVGLACTFAKLPFKCLEILVIYVISMGTAHTQLLIFRFTGLCNS